MLKKKNNQQHVRKDMAAGFKNFGWWNKNNLSGRITQISVCTLFLLPPSYTQ